MPDLQHKPIPAQHGLRSGREAVLTFLNSAQKENCPLSVRASAAGEVFTSYILGAEGDRLYIDQRIRREGLDVQLMQAASARVSSDPV